MDTTNGTPLIVAAVSALDDESNMVEVQTVALDITNSLADSMRASNAAKSTCGSVGCSVESIETLETAEQKVQDQLVKVGQMKAALQTLTEQTEQSADNDEVKAATAKAKTNLIAALKQAEESKSELRLATLAIATQSEVSKASCPRTPVILCATNDLAKASRPQIRPGLAPCTHSRVWCIFSLGFVRDGRGGRQ